MSKKQFTKAIIFISGFLLILQTVTYVIRTNGDVKDRFTDFYAEKQNTIDVMIIGSSPVYPCYAAPKIWGEYGIACYPLSSNRQRPKAMLGLVKEVEKTQNPSLYIFEVKQFTATEDFMTENMAYTRGITDNMKYSINRIEMINNLVNDVDDRYSYYFDIFKYHSNWKTIVLPNQLDCYEYEKLDPLKGFLFQVGVVPSNGIDFSSVTKKAPIPKENKETLYQLLNYLKNKNFQALFIVTPYAMKDAQNQMNYNYMKEIINSYGYDFLNMNNYQTQIKVDFNTDFFDEGIHTNAIGAEKYTKYLAEYINNHYVFEDKRGNENYKSWDDAYKVWSEQMKKDKLIIEERIQKGKYGEVETD